MSSSSMSLGGIQPPRPPEMGTIVARAPTRDGTKSISSRGTMRRSRLLPQSEKMEGPPEVGADDAAAAHRSAVHGPLRVFPAAVRFVGIQDGAEYHCKLRVTHGLSRAARVRFVGPSSTSKFTLSAPTAGPLAPGVEQTAEVVFRTPAGGSLRDHSDVVRILLADHEVSIPLRALARAPEVEAPARVDFGVVKLGSVASQEFVIRNVGTAEARWWVDVEGGLPLRALPGNGGLAANTYARSLDMTGRVDRSQQAEIRRRAPQARVVLELDAETPGPFRALVTLRVEGRPPRAVDVSATVVPHSVELVWPNGGGPVAGVDFGPCFVGRSAERKMWVVNNGPEQASFAVRVAPAFAVQRPGASEAERMAPGRHAAGAGAVATDEEGLEIIALESDGKPEKSSLEGGSLGGPLRDVEIEPFEGTVAPFSHTELTVRFRPLERAKPPAFKTQARRAVAARAATASASSFSSLNRQEGDHQDGGDVAARAQEELDALESRGLAPPPLAEPVRLDALVHCPETSERIVVPCSGVASRAGLAVGRKRVFFGECDIGDRRDVLVTLRNPSEAADIAWEAERIAHFACKPRRGTLLPLQTQKVVVSFLPRSMGPHRIPLHFIGAQGLVRIPLVLIGTATPNVVPRQPIGPDADPATLRTQYKFVSGDPPRLGSATKTSSGPPSYPWESKSAEIPGDAPEPDATSPSASSPPTSPDKKATAKKSSRAAGHEDGDADRKRKEAKARLEHDRAYNKLLEQQRVRREKREEVKSRRRAGAIPHWDDDRTLGMEDGKYDLESPTMGLKLPRAQDEPLWLARPLDADGKPRARTLADGDLGAGGTTVVRPDTLLDPNRRPKRRFKPSPTTQAEVRDCDTALSSMQLRALTAGPSAIDFGATSVGAVLRKTWSIHNGLPTCIRVEFLLPDKCPELAKSLPAAQVVPPDATAGFEAVYAPLKEGALRAKIRYRINGRHEHAIDVKGTAAGLDLVPSESEILFRFPDGSTAFELRKDLELSNPCAVPVLFKWRLPENTCFSIDPEDGEVQPNGKLTVSITYQPQYSHATTAKAVLLVKGGSPDMPPRKVLLIGEPDDPALSYRSSSRRNSNANAGPGRSVSRAGSRRSSGRASPIRKGSASSRRSQTQANRLTSKPSGASLTAGSAVSEEKEKEGDLFDFGAFSVGVERSSSLEIRSTGKTAAVFRVQRAPAGVEISPAQGRVAPGETIELEAKFRADRPRELDASRPPDEVIVKVRGGLTLRLRTNAKAVTPLVRLVAPEVDSRQASVSSLAAGGVGAENDLPETGLVALPPVDFGPVTVGGRGRRRLQLVNACEVPAEVMVDLREHPEFVIEPPGGLMAAASDEHSVAGETVLMPADAEPVGDSASAAGAGAGGVGMAAPEGAFPRQFRVKLRPSTALPVDLVFRPTELASHDFALPVTVTGVRYDLAGDAEAAALHARVILAEAVAPVLKVSRDAVEFEYRVVQEDPGRRIPFAEVVTITNVSAKRTNWWLDDATFGSEGIFGVSPAQGQLHPRESVDVAITFSPNRHGDFSGVLPLYLGNRPVPGQEPPGAQGGVLGGEHQSSGELQAEDVDYHRQVGSKDGPYLVIETRGTGIAPQLSFDMREVRLPTVPLGETAAMTFHVIGHGYDHLELKWRVPSDKHPAKVPLRIYFPQGSTLSPARPVLPVVVAFASRRPMGFTTSIEFKDDRNARFSMPVSGVTDNSVLTVAPWIGARRASLEWIVPPCGAPRLVAAGTTDTAALHAASKFAGVSPQALTLPPASFDPAGAGAGAGATSGGKKPARGGSRGGSKGGGDGDAKGGSRSFVGHAPVMLDDESEAGQQGDAGLGPAELGFWPRFLSSAVTGTPSTRPFPEDLLLSHGRPLWDAIEQLAGTRIPHRAPGRLPPPGRERTLVLYKEATEALTFLRAHGALLHVVRAEELLAREDYVRLRRAAPGAFGTPPGAPVLEYPTPARRLRKRRDLAVEWSRRSPLAWAAVVAQTVRVFLLARVGPAALAATPGMNPEKDPAVQRAIAAVADAEAKVQQIVAEAADERRRRGGGVSGGKPGEENELPAGAKGLVAAAKREAFAPDARLAGSNVLSAAEYLLLRWLQYHYNASFPDTPRRIVDPHRDLRDGMVLAGALLSHAKHLGDEGGPLASLRPNPKSDEDCKYNWHRVMEALHVLELEPPFEPELFLGAGASAIPGEWEGLRAWEARVEAHRLELEAKDRERRRLSATHNMLARLNDGADTASLPTSAGGGPGDVVFSNDAPDQDAAAGNHASNNTPELESSQLALRGAMFDTSGIVVHGVATGGASGQQALARPLPGEGPPRACFLAVLWLFRELPQLVSRAELVFEGALGSACRKQVEVTNPLDRPIVYYVSIEGDADGVFDVENRTVSVGPRETATATLLATAQHSVPASGRAVFRPRREGGPTQPATLVFSLRTRVVERAPVSTLALESPLYSATRGTVEVRNPYSKQARFRVRLVPMPPTAKEGANVPEVGPELYPGQLAESGDPGIILERDENATTPGTGPNPSSGGGGGGTKKPRSPSRGGRRRGRRGERLLRVGEWAGRPNEAGALTGNGRWPAPFFCAAREMRLSAGAVASLPVEFLPFTLGPHACAVELVDLEGQGELVFEVRAQAMLPPPLATVRCEATADEELLVSLRVAGPNTPMLHALDAVLQRLSPRDQSIEKDARDRRRRDLLHRLERAARHVRLAQRSVDRSIDDLHGQQQPHMSGSLPSLPSYASAADVAGPPSGRPLKLPGLVFSVDADSPFFDVPDKAFVALPALAEGWLVPSAQDAAPANHRASAGSTHNKPGKRTSMLDMATAASPPASPTSDYSPNPQKSLGHKRSSPQSVPSASPSESRPSVADAGQLDAGFSLLLENGRASQPSLHLLSAGPEGTAAASGLLGVPADGAMEEDPAGGARPPLLSSASQASLAASVGPGAPRLSADVPLLLQPRQPGVYRAVVALLSDRETRVYNVQVAVSPPAIERQLLFRVPSANTVTQNLPIVNPSPYPWQLHLELETETSPASPNANTLAHTKPRSGSRGMGATRGDGAFSAPKAMQVDRGQTVQIPLTFAPRAPGEYRARLRVLSKRKAADAVDGDDEASVPAAPPLEFVLVGEAQEAAAEGTLSIECAARETVRRPLRIRNPLRDRPLKLEVETDLPFASGDAFVTLPPAGEVHYELVFRPQLSGTYIGTVNFIEVRSRIDGGDGDDLGTDDEDEHGDERKRELEDEEDDNDAEDDEGGGMSKKCSNAILEGRQVLWYGVEAQVAGPPPEGVVSVRAHVRQPVKVSVEVRNPLREPLQLEAVLDGPGLDGDRRVRLGPGAIGEYEFVFCPFAQGTAEGVLRLQNERVGELWWKLDLEAEPAPPIMLPELHCHLGRTVTCDVTIDNPRALPSRVRVANVLVEDGTGQPFAVSPEVLDLQPYSSGVFSVQYSPTAVQDEQRAIVLLDSDELGAWEIRAMGSGDAPEGITAEVEVAAAAGASGSSIVAFRNPFDDPLVVSLDLDLDVDGNPEKAQDDAGPSSDRLPSIGRASGRAPDSGMERGSVSAVVSAARGESQDQTSSGRPPIFRLLRSGKMTIPPRSVAQIPVSFAPPSISESWAILRIQAQDRGLEWLYSIHGVAQAPPSKRVLSFRCRARTRDSDEIELKLRGMPPTLDLRHERFDVEVLAPEAVLAEVHQAFTFTVLNAGNKLVSHDDKLRIGVEMHPKRPFRARVRLAVSKSSGGRWTWDMVLDVSEAEPDDTIHIAAELGRPSSVAIQLMGTTTDFEPFTAAFSLDSAPELSVTPARGTLPPAGSRDPAELVVSFAPREYGRPSRGRLIVDTEARQWIFSVVGSPPEWEPPQAQGTRLNTHIDRNVDRAMRTRAKERERRNFLKRNAATARTYKRPEAKATNFRF